MSGIEHHPVETRHPSETGHPTEHRGPEEHPRPEHHEPPPPRHGDPDHPTHPPGGTGGTEHHDPPPPPQTTQAPPPPGTPDTGTPTTAGDPSTQAPSPASPLLAAAQALEPVHDSEEPIAYGKDHKPLPSNRERAASYFTQHGEAPHTAWKEYADRALALSKERRDPLADRELLAALERWQSQKDRNPFDAAALTELAKELKSRVDEFRASVEARTDLLPDQRWMLLGGTDALAAELARQARDLHDPVNALTRELTGLAWQTQGPARRRLEEYARDLDAAAAWSGTKKRLLSAIRSEDRSLAKEVDASMDQDFGAALERWKKLMKANSFDAPKIMSCVRTISSTALAYDRKLKDVYDGSGGNMKVLGYIAALRDGVHITTEKVTKEFEWVAKMGAFDQPAR